MNSFYFILFFIAFLNIHRSGVLTALTLLVPPEIAAVSVRSVYTIQSCTMSLHAKPHTSGVTVFSCNLPPALSAEWPACYCGNTGVELIGNKSQHRKFTLEKKILPPVLQGFEPATFQSRVRRSDHLTIPLPSDSGGGW